MSWNFEGRLSSWPPRMHCVLFRHPELNWTFFGPSRIDCNGCRSVWTAKIWTKQPARRKMKSRQCKVIVFSVVFDGFLHAESIEAILRAIQNDAVTVKDQSRPKIMFDVVLKFLGMLNRLEWRPICHIHIHNMYTYYKILIMTLTYYVYMCKCINQMYIYYKIYFLGRFRRSIGMQRLHHWHRLVGHVVRTSQTARRLHECAALLWLDPPTRQFFSK